MPSQFLSHLGSLDTLTDEQRDRLANLLVIRGEYLTHLQKLTLLRATAVRHPKDAAAQAAVTDYADIVLAPVGLRMAEEASKLFKVAVDLSAVKPFVPLILTNLLLQVDLAKLLESLGVATATAEKISGDTAAYVNNFEQASFEQYLNGLLDDLETTKLAGLTKAVNVEGLRGVVPALAIGLLQQVNPGLFLTAMGADPDQMSMMLKGLRESLSQKEDSAE